MTGPAADDRPTQWSPRPEAEDPIFAAGVSRAANMPRLTESQLDRLTIIFGGGS